MINKIRHFFSIELNWIKLLLFIPIIFVLIISLTHMTTWFSLSDTVGWAKFLGTAIVLITFSTMAASKFTNWSFVAYLLIFIVELAGNYFHAFTNIDINSKEFMDWNTSIEPLLNLFIYEPDINVKRRFLALLHGGILPVIGFIFFSFLLYLGTLTTKTIDIQDEDAQDVDNNNDNDDNADNTNNQLDIVDNTNVDVQHNIKNDIKKTENIVDVEDETGVEASIIDNVDVDGKTHIDILKEKDYSYLRIDNGGNDVYKYPIEFLDQEFESENLSGWTDQLETFQSLDHTFTGEDITSIETDFELEPTNDIIDEAIEDVNSNEVNENVTNKAIKKVIKKTIKK